MDRIDEVEGCIREDPQVLPVDEVVMDPTPMAVVPLGQADHRWRDVDTVHALEVSCQGLRQPAHSAAEVEGPAPWEIDALLIEHPEGVGDLQPAGVEELTAL